MKYSKLTIAFFLSVASCSFAQQKNLDSLYSVLQNAKEDTSKFNKLTDLSYDYSLVNPDEGIRIGEEAIKLAEKLDWEKGIAIANNNIAVNYSNKAEYTKALDYYFKALEINNKLDNKVGVAKSYSNLGVVYSRLSDFTKASDYYEKALNINIELKDSAGIAGQLNNIGITYDSQSNYPEALEYYFKALKINEAIGNKKGIAGTINGIAGVYFEQSDFAKALEYTFKALKLNQESGNKNWEANNLDNLGYIYSAQRNYKKAEEYFFKALAIHKEIDNKFGEAATLSNIGINYQAQSNYTKALENNLKSLEMSERMGDKAGEEINLGSIGLTYYSIAKDSNKFILNKLFGGNKTSSLNKAKEHFDRAILIAKEIGDLDNLSKDYFYLSDIQVMLGDYKNSLENYKNYSTLRDSTFNLEKDKKLTQTAMQYDFDKKQAVTKAESDAEIQRQKTLRNNLALIAGLILFGIVIFIWLYKRKRDAEQETKDTATKLKISETELKALRLQINSHFIFNAMQTVQKYLRDNKPHEAEKLLLMFSKLTRSILENSEKEEITLRRELEVLEWYMNIENERMTYPFTYKFNIDNNIDADDTFVPPNILQPFIENSIKHGFTHKNESGNITILVSKEENDLHIIIEDDGIGREASKKLKEVDDKKESLGVKITEERLNNLNSKNKSNSALKIIDLITSNKPSGTRVEINLPFSND